MPKNRLFTVIRVLVLGLLLIFVLHFETLSIGPIKISHLWKGLLLILVFTKVKQLHFLYKPLILLAVVQLISFDIVLNPISALVSFSTILLFALGGIYLLRFNSRKIEDIILFFSSVFILSFIPYKLGLLTSIGEGYSLKGYGVEASGLIGPFQKVHSASATLAVCLITLIYFWFKNQYSKIYISALFLFGFYFLFYTYVRTGMVMFAIGVIPIVVHFGKQNARSFFKVLVLIALSAVLISVWVLSNDTLLRRISGERDYYQEDSIETIGSGRLKFFISSIEIFAEENAYEKILGIGETEQLHRMKDKIGLALFPHNGFLLLLLANGILGLYLFLKFLRSLVVFNKRSNNDGSPLLWGLTLAFIVMTFFQSYDIITVCLLLALGIANVRSLEIITKLQK